MVGDRAYGGIREIVGRDIDGLDCRDGALPGRQDTVFELGDLRDQSRLVPDRRGHASEQRGNLAAGLHEAKDVVHHEQHLFLDGVAQELGVGQSGEPDAEAHAR